MKRHAYRNPTKHIAALSGRWMTLLAGISAFTLNVADAKQPQVAAPCHSNPHAAEDREAVLNRGDVRNLPDPLRNRLAELATRPHSQLPTQAYAEADQPSQLFQYYLLDTNNFEPNPFTSTIAGVNDTAMLTATGPDCGLSTIASVRAVLEPKPDLPRDPNDVRAFIDIFTDAAGLFVINNESGWYEGWMIHDLRVAPVAPALSGGRPQFGTITATDAAALQAAGTHHNVPGEIFTVDGNAVHFPTSTDHFPDRQTNVVPIQLSMGAWNTLQQSDGHAYWEFKNDPVRYGDNPNNKGVLQASGPRDPDKFDADDDAQREFRQRFIPSGLAKEIFLDVYERATSFEPGVTDFKQRLFDAYAVEVARVDANGDGVVSAAEGDVDNGSDGFADNARLFIPVTQFNRFAVTREINDGLLAPRFAPSQKAWVLSGTLVPVSPAVPASAGRDGDDR